MDPITIPLRCWREEVFHAYLAGLVDGEGHIEIQGNYVQVSIANTFRRVLDQIQKRLGYGKIYSQKNKLATKTCYNFVIGRFPQNRDLLLRVLPYLTIKEVVTKKALALLNTRWVEECRLTPRQEALLQKQRQSFGLLRRMCAGDE